MNGRIYDPTLGRFLQADPFIQAPKNSQNYNRYSYVLNNPLSYTDPSGYFVKSFLKGMMKVTGTGHILRALAKVPILNSAVQIAIGIGCGTAAAQCLAAYNGLQSYAVTGSLGAGLRTAAISYAQSWSLQQIGASKTWGEAGSIANVSANALVGGVSAELQGGNFGHGFVSAGVASAFKPLLNDIGGENSAKAAIDRGDVSALSYYKVHRIIGASVIGGTTSVISGGKFANGAVTGAFNQMFNGERHLITEAYNTDVMLRRGKMTKQGADYISSGLNRQEKNAAMNSYFPEGTYVVAAHGNNMGMQIPGHPLGTTDMKAISAQLIGYNGRSDIFLNVCDAGFSGLAQAFAIHYPGVNVIAISSGLINLVHTYPRPNLGAGAMKIYKSEQKR